MLADRGEGVSPLTIERLSDHHRPAIDALIAAANEYEGLDLPMDPEGDGFVYLEDGEILGVVGLEAGKVVESTGAVHPDHRRRGVGTALLNALIVACREQGTQTCYVVLDEASPSGKTFIADIGARYHISEHRMLLERDTFHGAGEWDDLLDLVPATHEDLDLYASLVAEAFGDPAEVQRAWLDEDMRRPNRRFWIARTGDEPVGTVRTIGPATTVYTTTLGVLPRYRGRRYGRQILSRITAMLVEEGWEQILIEVETENRTALGLYQSVGYREIRTYGFYRIPL